VIVTRPPLFVWPYALAFWPLFLLVFVPEVRLEHRARADAQQHRAQDKGSVRIIPILGRASFWLALAAAIFVSTATISPGRDGAFTIGVLSLAAGALLRHHCFRMLGPSFRGTVSVQPDQTIVQRGAYRWIRHPSYTGAMLMMVGVGLAMTNWLSIVILTLLPALGYGYRVRLEEQAMLATLGERYRVYMSRTKRFVPFVL